MNRHRTHHLSGQPAIQLLKLSAAPDAGSFTLTVPSVGTTAAITAPITAGSVQTALRALTGLSTVTVAAVGAVSALRISFPAADAALMTVGSNTATKAGVAVTTTVTKLQSWASGLEAVSAIATDPVQYGDTVRLVATAVGQTITNGTLVLNGDWVSTGAGDWIVLFCDGTTWREQSRKNSGAQGTIRRTVAFGTAIFTPTETQSIYILKPGQTNPPAKATSSGYGANGAFYLDPARLAESGRTLKFEIEAELLCNDTAPGSSWFVSLYKLSSVTGASGAQLYVAHSDVTASGQRPTPWSVGTVTANMMDRQVGTQFTLADAGWYHLCTSFQNAPMAAASAVQIRASLLAVLT